MWESALNLFHLTRGEAAWVGVLAAALALVVGVGEFRARRRAGAPVDVNAGDVGRYAYRIDLNAADWAELALLPGIGEVTAKRVVAYRTKIGGFSRLEQLAEVRGISRGRVDALRDCVVIGQPTTPKK